MKIKFKIQPFQTAAVQAVVDCFRGQPPQHGGIRYRLDPGRRSEVPASPQAALTLEPSHAAVAEQDGAIVKSGVCSTQR